MPRRPEAVFQSEPLDYRLRLVEVRGSLGAINKRYPSQFCAYRGLLNATSNVAKIIPAKVSIYWWLCSPYGSKCGGTTIHSANGLPKLSNSACGCGSCLPCCCAQTAISKLDEHLKWSARSASGKRSADSKSKISAAGNATQVQLIWI